MGQSCDLLIPLCSLLVLRVGRQESNHSSSMVQLHRGGKLMVWPHPGSLWSFVSGELLIWSIHRGQQVSLLRQSLHAWAGRRNICRQCGRRRVLKVNPAVFDTHLN